jgi:hypothetical protein
MSIILFIHARYGENEVKVNLYEKDGTIFDVDYVVVSGKFSPAKMSNLRVFINENKNAILFAWRQCFEQNVKIKPIKITKRIR